MAGRKSSIGAQLTLDKRGFKAALDGAKQDAGAFKAGLEQMKISKGALAGEGFAVGRWTELNSQLQVIGGGFRMATSGAVGFAKSIFEGELSFEALLRGLASTSDGAETLREEIDALQELAKKPGLGFREVMEGSLALKGAGTNAKDARDSLEAFGNALTNAGKSKQDLKEVLLHLTAIISTGKKDADRVKEITTRIPAFMAMDQQVSFSEGPIKWLQGIIGKLRELPAAAESGQDALDNLQDAIDQKKLGISGGAAVEGALQAAKVFGSVIEGKFSIDDIMKGYDKIQNAPDLISKYQPSETELARRKKVKDELAAAEAEQKRLAEQKVKDDEEAAKKAQLAASKPQRDEAMASLEVLRLRAAGKNKQADKIEQKKAEAARAKQLEEAGMPSWQASSIAEEETSLNKTIASGRRKTYKGEADTGFKGLELLDAMRNRMDLKPLSEEWSFTGLDDYKRLQSNNRPKKEASAAAGSRANATAGDPVTKALNDWGPKMVQELTAVNQKLEAINSKPVDRL